MYFFILLPFTRHAVRVYIAHMATINNNNQAEEANMTRYSIFNTAETHASATFENAAKMAEQTLNRAPRLVVKIDDNRGIVSESYKLVDGTMQPAYAEAGDQEAA